MASDASACRTQDGRSDLRSCSLPFLLIFGLRRADIGDARAREKTCQALREGAPAIRRKRKGGNKSKAHGTSRRDDEGEAETITTATTVDDVAMKEEDDVSPRTTTTTTSARSDDTMMGLTTSSSSSASLDPTSAKSMLLDLPPMMDRCDLPPFGGPVVGGRYNQRDQTFHGGSNDISIGRNDGPSTTPTKDIRIQPSARLLRRNTFTSISLDELSPQDRELYLRDFLPPLPSSMQRKRPSLEQRDQPQGTLNLYQEHASRQDNDTAPSGRDNAVDLRTISARDMAGEPQDATTALGTNDGDNQMTAGQHHE